MKPFKSNQGSSTCPTCSWQPNSMSSFNLYRFRSSSNIQARC